MSDYVTEMNAAGGNTRCVKIFIREHAYIQWSEIVHWAYALKILIDNLSCDHDSNNKGGF